MTKKTRTSNIFEQITEIYLILMVTVFLLYTGRQGFGWIAEEKYRAFLLICRTDTPSRKYSPVVGVSRQPRILSMVYFPEPLVPMMVTNAPSDISNATPRKAWTVSEPTWKSRRIS